MANRTENNTAKKKIIIKGKEFPSLAVASKELNVSRFKLLQKLYSPNEPDFLFHDHDKEIERFKDYLYLKSFILTEESLRRLKKQKKTMKEIAKMAKVSLDTVRLAFDVYGLEKKFQQVNDQAFKVLEDPENLKGLLEESNAEILSRVLNISPSAIHHRAKSYGIPLESATSLGEQEIGEFVSSLTNTKVERNVKIGGFELDVFVPEFSFAIEYHGLWWHREKPSLHAQKAWSAFKNGVRLIQVWEDDWQFKKELVQKKIAHILGFNHGPVIGARKCEIFTLTNADVSLLNEAHHIQGHKNCQINFGLIHENRLVAVMGFNGVHLERFTTSEKIPGGFAKLFKHAIEKTGNNHIISFANLMWTHPEKNIYLSNGFKQVCVTRPNYFWVVNGRRESRLKFQKHKLPNLFENFNPEMSEREWMESQGFYRVFDAGHIKYEWRT